MRKSTRNTVMHSYPGMVAIVTVSNDGQDNIMAAGWHSYISYQPPIYGVAIGRERFTHGLMSAAGSFAINFLPYEQATIIQESGVLTGETTDKFTKRNIKFDRGLTTDAPILQDAYIAYECKTIDVNRYGDHDWFVGEITYFYKDESLFLKNGLPDLNKLEIPLYLGRSSYAKLDINTEIKTIKT
ncbi:flavin oxidoreductase [Aquibacillus halophilus]|uniref:Flavin oxidoreductase n=1 Tax=Aquibacillus halophilus TaxID=930132 RepID=A0A6A8D872_9BACI|nr:flavin reductase family protein [Aquibacillus halophilus]MRH41794.1 flavin oxidoreductase [Aquibacillus halophilus]